MIPRFPTLDHIIPKIRGGSNRQDNLQMLCIGCHKIKDAHFPKLSNDVPSHLHSPFQIIVVISKIEYLNYLPRYDGLKNPDMSGGLSESNFSRIPPNPRQYCPFITTRLPTTEPDSGVYVVAPHTEDSIKFFRDYKEILKKRFDQLDILITYYPIENV